MEKLTISGMVALYRDHAATYYRKPSGRPTNTINNIRNATKSLCDARVPYGAVRLLVGSLPADAMCLKLLRLVRDTMIDGGNLCRTEINDRVKWIRTMYRWAAEQELVDESIPPRLDLLKPLQRGRSAAHEAEGVQAVSWEHVAATLAHAPLRLPTMIEVQWWTGMRPAEVVAMKWSEIDQSSQPWVYRPAESKSEHVGNPRVIALGPTVQSLLRQWRRHCRGDALWPMTRGSYNQAVKRINRRHKLAAWQPRQIRHSAASRIAEETSLEAARAVLGHKSITTTEIYLDRGDEGDRRAARDAMNRLG